MRPISPRRRNARFEELSARLLLTVTTVENTVTVDASEEPNEINLVMGSDLHTLTIDGEVHEFDANVVDRILIYANEGADTVTLQGSGTDERVETYDRSTELLSTNYIARIEDAESISIDTGEGSDHVEFVDSEGEDLVALAPDRATFARSNGQTVVVTGHEQAEAFAHNGGNDIVNFTDSSGDDRFTAKYLRSFMIGDGFINYARGFESVNAESSAGGEDEARLLDSPVDDHLEVSGTMASYRVEFATHTVNGFPVTRAYSTEGNDTATVLGNHFVSDVFRWTPDSAFMYSTGIYDATAPELFQGERIDDSANIMVGFADIEATGSDPSDRAELRGTEGDDRLIGLPSKVEFTTPNARVEATSFGVVAATGQGGDDVAFLEDSAGNDRYVGRSRGRYLEGSNYLNYVAGFDTDVVSRNGGEDTFSLVDYTGPGRDYLVQQTNRLMVIGPERSERLIGFSNGTGSADNAGLLVFAPYFSPIELNAGHRLDDLPEDELRDSFERRIDQVFEDYEVVDGDIKVVGAMMEDPPAVDPDPPAETDPPATDPPVTDPPTVPDPPVDAVDPPTETDPPASEADPPATDPPATDPPTVPDPPVDVIDPPTETDPPGSEADPPATDPPTEPDPPVDVIDPPTETDPPVSEADPPATDPPATDPPVSEADPPATDPDPIGDVVDSIVDVADDFIGSRRVRGS